MLRFLGSVSVGQCGEQLQGHGTANHSLLDAGPAQFTPHYPAPTLSGFFGAFGTVMYAFNFVPVFPTIQADMADKGRFKWVVVISCLLIFARDGALTLFGYKGRYSVLFLSSIPFLALNDDLFSYECSVMLMTYELRTYKMRSL